MVINRAIIYGARMTSRFILTLHVDHIINNIALKLLKWCKVLHTIILLQSAEDISAHIIGLMFVPHLHPRRRVGPDPGTIPGEIILKEEARRYFFPITR